MRPASTLDRSRMSLISDSKWRPEERMSSTYSFCLSFSSPKNFSSSTSEKPMIAFSGVRSSCETFARNSDLCRLAASISRFLSPISRNSRVMYRQGRLRREGLQQVDYVWFELTDLPPPHCQAAQNLLLAQQWHGKQ